MSILKVRNLKYQKNGRIILNNISLDIQKSGSYCIIGENGAGKSTLAYILMGVKGYSNYKGNIIFKNENINKLNIYKRAKKGIALAWQEPARFEGITVQKYLDALDMAEEYGIEFCIIDSSTHLWSGDGGLLEKHSEYAKKLGNSFTAWAKITPMHNKFVSRMLECDMHLIATMRSKQEYVTEKNNNGRTSVRKVGLEPQQRKGMEYEFTVFLEIDDEHKAFGSKDRTSLFDQKTFIITPDTGAETMAWLLSGKTLAPKVVMTKDKFGYKERNYSSFN